VPWSTGMLDAMSRLLPAPDDIAPQKVNNGGTIVTRASTAPQANRAPVGELDQLSSRMAASQNRFIRPVIGYG